MQHIDIVSLSEQAVVAARVGIAAMLGAVIGLERELSGKRAGTRTHMLVAAASALAVGLGAIALQGMSGDATRTFHGVLTGVGFIGAGAILHSKKGPSGLTTATTILLVAVIGATCAFGAPILAAIVTAFALATLRGVHLIENKVRKFVAARRAAGVVFDDDLDNEPD